MGNLVFSFSLVYNIELQKDFKITTLEDLFCTISSAYKLYVCGQKKNLENSRQLPDPSVMSKRHRRKVAQISSSAICFYP